MTPDVNVLVAAARLEHPHHNAALNWLELAVNDTDSKQRLTLLPGVIAGFLRITTNRKVFPVPTPIEAAVGFIDDMLDSARVSVLSDAREWPQLRALCLQKSLIANMIPDAWIAALVLEHREVLATFDSDFSQLLPEKNLLLLNP
jgi:uncharacterized protein